jgi:hypothetical protein
MPSSPSINEDPTHHLAELLTQAQLLARRLNAAAELPEADRTTLRELAWLTFTAFEQKRPDTTAQEPSEQ